MGGMNDTGIARVLAVGVMLVLALGGCGDLSLYSTLEGDMGGEFRLSPQKALVPEKTPFTFTALGGFLPYDVAVAGLTAKGEHTWEFPGKDISPGTTQDFMIEATDLLGNKATATVTVYAEDLPPLVISDTAITLTVGDTWTFTASGGQPPYTWYLDEVKQLYDVDNYPFTAGLPGVYTVSVTDSLGIYREAIVTVSSPPAPGVPLVISPEAASVAVNGVVLFQASGGESGTYTFSTALPGSIASTGLDTATYKAPGSAGTYSVQLTDGFTIVSAAIVVTAAAPLPLALWPESPTVHHVGDTVQFAATGGVPPYTFSSKKPSRGDFLDPVTHPGLYTQLQKKDGVVFLKDSTGAKTQTTVKWH